MTDAARTRRRLAAIVVTALALRLVALAAVAPTPLAGDELDYFWRASERSKGITPDDEAFRPPASELYYAALFRSFGETIAVARLGNVTLSVALLLPLFSLARRYGGDRTGLLAAAIAAVYPTFIAFSHYLWSETLYTFLTVTGLALLAAHAERASPARVFTAGIAFGLSVLTRVAGIGFPLLAAAWLLWRGRAHGWRAAVAPACLLAGTVAPVVPWSLHLDRPDAPFAPVTRTTWLYLYIGNAEPAHGVSPVIHYESLGETRIEKEARAKEIVLETIAERLPWWPLEKIASEVPAFFTPTSFSVRRLLMPADHAWWPNRAWAYRFSLDPGDWDRTLRVAAVAVLVGSYGFVVLTGALGLALGRASPTRQLLLLFVAAQVAGPVATFAISRFRVPAMAAFAIGAAWVLARGAPAWREAAPRERWLAIAAAAAIAGMIAMRWGDLSSNAWA